MTHKAIGKQLAYLRRDLNAIDGKLSLGKNLPPRQTERLGTIRAVYEQQKYMYDNRTRSVPDRIVSVSQPFVRPIVRGKAGKPVEFGAKLDISVVDGWTRLECCSFDAYNEAGNGRAVPSARGALPQPDPGGQNLPKPGESQLLQGAGGSVFPARLWGGPRRVKPETRLRTIGMSASAWKWSADSLWRSVNVAWGWSLQSCGRLRPM